MQIKQANSLLGAFVGAISGAFVCYVFIGIVAALETGQSATVLTEIIKGSDIAVLLYHDNYVANLLTTFLTK